MTIKKQDPYDAIKSKIKDEIVKLYLIDYRNWNHHDVCFWMEHVVKMTKYLPKLRDLKWTGIRLDDLVTEHLGSTNHTCKEVF